MERIIRILVQTTIPAEPDNWSIDSLSLLTRHLASLQENDTRFEVTGRNRATAPNVDDPVLSILDQSSYDELWLFALDNGEGITSAECQAVTRFRRRGGGILTTRDHQDMGSSLCTLGGIGAAHFFQSRNPEPDPERHHPDDTETPSISWPNYHSGRNGDYQTIVPAMPDHELLRNPASGRPLQFFPAHPHEGAVGPPPDDASAHVVACGKSRTTGRPFNLVVAFERQRDADGNLLGRGVAESSFHHFADYNWDTRYGAPSFVTEPEGKGMSLEPRALPEIKQYVRNLAFWLAPPAA
jgi:hypothetical protein